MSRKEKLNKLYEKISEAKYEMDLSWHKFIENNSISDRGSPQFRDYYEKLAYYNGLVESIMTLGFDEHYNAWQKKIKDDLPF